MKILGKIKYDKKTAERPDLGKEQQCLVKGRVVGIWEQCDSSSSLPPSPLPVLFTTALGLACTHRLTQTLILCPF